MQKGCARVSTPFLHSYTFPIYSSNLRNAFGR